MKAQAHLVRARILFEPGKYGAFLVVYKVLGVREQEFGSRKYLWFVKEKLPQERVSDREYLANPGDADAVLVEVRDVGKKHDNVILVLAKPSDKSSVVEVNGEKLLELQNATILAFAVAGEGKRGWGEPRVYDNAGVDVTDRVKQLAVLYQYGISKSSNIKAAHNMLAIVYKHFANLGLLPSEASEAKPSEASKPATAGTGSIVQRIEQLLSEIATAAEQPAQQPAAAPAEEQKEQKPEEKQQAPAEASAVVDLQRGIIKLPTGDILVRFYLVKFQKTSEYAVQAVDRRLNGSKEIEEVRKIPAEVASMLSSLRRRVNEELASIAKLVTMEAVYGKSSGMWLALDAEAVEAVKRLHAKALAELQSDPRYQRLPKELQRKLLGGFRIHVSEVWYRLEDAIQLLHELKTAVEAAKKEKEQKLQQLKKSKASKELKRFQQLVQKLEQLEKRLQELAQLKP